MSKPKEIFEIATMSLEAITNVAKSANSEINERREIDINRYNNQYSWNDQQLSRYNLERNRDRIEQLYYLAKEPIIGGVECFDIEKQCKCTIYVSRLEPPLTSYISQLAPPPTPNSKVFVVSYKTPMASIISRKVGDIAIIPKKPFGHSEYEIENKIELHPVKRNDRWDSKNNRISILEIGDYTIDSLINLLSESTAQTDEEENEELDSIWEQSSTENFTVGFKRPIIENMSLRDQPILDEFQDKIFRMPINCQCFLSGPPGTGKTTTLIRRLSQKTDLIALESYEELEDYKNEFGLIKTAEEEIGTSHDSSWIMFSPKELLRQYVKEAFNREKVAAPDENIQTWENFRHKIARDNLGILRTGLGRGQFIEKHEKFHLLLEPIDQTKWYEDFQNYLELENAKEMTLSAELLQKSMNPIISRLGLDLLSVVKQMKSGTYSSGLSNLSKMLDELKKVKSEVTKSLERKLTKFSNELTFADKSFVHKLSEQLAKQKLSINNSDEQIEEDSDIDNLDDESDTENRISPNFSKSHNLLCKAIIAAAIEKVNGRKVSSQDGLLLTWLGEKRLPSDDELINIGNILNTQSHIGKFMGIEKFYLQSISRHYKIFRNLRAKEGLWYKNSHMKSNEITVPEIDILILITLRMAQEMLNYYRHNKQSKNSVDRLKAVKRIQRAQILVDEATDFSVIQLGCMYELAHPRMRSFFMCGDFNQRLTEWGIKSVDELNWIDAKIQMENINISYRQSEKLVELAGSLARIGNENTTKINIPVRTKSNEYKPIWQTHLDDFDKIADWLAPRIKEINSIIIETTTIGVLVNDESQVEPLAQKLTERLEEISLKAEACYKGIVVGNDKDVRVFDIEHIKGLEFESIFYVSLDETIQNHPLLFSKYLYVGATRAATFFGVTFKGEISPEVQHLNHYFGKNWQIES